MSSLLPHGLYVADQPALSMEFCRQEFLSGWPFTFPGNLSEPRTEPWFPTLWRDSLPTEPPGKLNQMFKEEIRPLLYQLFQIMERKGGHLAFF